MNGSTRAKGEAWLSPLFLRFLDLLAENTIKVKVEDFSIMLPRPANFALHKLIIFQRRQKAEKAIKDSNTSLSYNYDTFMDENEK